MYKVCDIQRIVSMLLFERSKVRAGGAEKNQGEAKGIISLPFCILLNN